LGNESFLADRNRTNGQAIGQCCIRRRLSVCRNL